MPQTAYDEFPYENYPTEETHPDRLAVVALLHGLEPPKVSTARVLDLGCGTGANLAGIANAYPGVRAVGVDLAQTAIAEANEMVADVGLTNAEYHVADLRDLADGHLGEFDYVMSHGVYGWVDHGTREALLAAMRSHLAPGGIGFLSFNSHPGGYFRQCLRDLAMWWNRGVEGEEERAERARRLFAELYEVRRDEDPYGELIGREMGLLSQSTNFLIHDLLSDHWEPVWFADFAEAAASHGMQYVADARFARLREDDWPEGVPERLDQLSGGNRIAREQLGDVLSWQLFRSCVLCGTDVEPSLAPDHSRVREFQMRQLEPAEDTDSPLVQQLLGALGELGPLPVTFDALHERVGGDADELCTAVMTACRRRRATLHVEPPAVGTAETERPAVNAVARWQASRKPVCGTRYNRTIGLSGEPERRLMSVIDGTRTREEICDAFGDVNGNRLAPQGLDAALANLAGIGMLDP